jgi:hypothetical protein
MYKEMIYLKVNNDVMYIQLQLQARGAQSSEQRSSKLLNPKPSKLKAATLKAPSSKLQFFKA